MSVRVLLLGTGALPIPPPGWGAVERAIDGLARSLGKLGVEVEVVHRVGKGGRFDEYRFALALPRLLKGKRWDLLHAFTPVVANRLALRGHPYVYTSHSRHWSGTSSPSERWGFYLEKRACAHGWRTIALTNEVAAKMTQVRPRTRQERIRVIPNGLELDDFRADWSVRHGTQVLGVGAIHPRKRWHLAARAMREVPEATLTLVGPIQDRAYAASLKAQAGGEHRLMLTGEVSVSELARRYAGADLLVHPSGSELLSISVMEAMASSLPVVGMDLLAEEVPEGTAGILVPEGARATLQVEGLRDAIARIVRDTELRHRLSEGARRTAEARYAWPKVAEATLAVYQELIRAPA